jgi:hypothetical protein
MSIIENQLHKKLELFSGSQQDYIKDLTTYPLSVNKSETYIILKAIRSMSEDSSEEDKETFIDLLEDLYIKEKNPVMHIADRGETVSVDIKLREGDNYTDSMLIARKADTKEALSSEYLEGSDAEVQKIELEDVDLPVGSFTKVVLLSEKPIDDPEDPGTDMASGDANAVLSKMYLYIDEDTTVPES